MILHFQDKFLPKNSSRYDGQPGKGPEEARYFKLECVLQSLFYRAKTHDQSNMAVLQNIGENAKKQLQILVPRSF